MTADPQAWIGRFVTVQRHCDSLAEISLIECSFPVFSERTDPDGLYRFSEFLPCVVTPASGLGLMAHHFDIVSVGVENKGRIVPPAILRT